MNSFQTSCQMLRKYSLDSYFRTVYEVSDWWLLAIITITVIMRKPLTYLYLLIKLIHSISVSFLLACL